MTDDSRQHLREVKELDELLQKLFPISRSLSGLGNRETFRILKELIPLELTEYPSGTQVYDWTIPEEWRIRDAWIKSPDGERLVDYQECNLHVVGYSSPVRQRMQFADLAPHLHCLESSPEAIPYRTSYYQHNWGFCVTAAQYKRLEDAQGPFEVCIDSELKSDGAMTVGELCIAGESQAEYLVSTYCCHPAMANDNLSGLLTATFLARDLLKKSKPQFSWRFVFVPETIGAIAYLQHNEATMKKLLGGLVITTCGGPGPLGYKETFQGDHLVDRAIRLAFRDRKVEPIRYPFAPDGSDERQYSSPGFRIPVASVTKDKYYEYSQYHTSLDNLDFVNGAQIAQSLAIYRDVIRVLDCNARYCSTAPWGEPQLSQRDLYPATGGSINQSSATGSDVMTTDIDAIMWVLFLSDSEYDLVTIAERADLEFARVVGAVDRLIDVGLLEKVSN